MNTLREIERMKKETFNNFEHRIQELETEYRQLGEKRQRIGREIQAAKAWAETLILEEASCRERGRAIQKHLDVLREQQDTKQQIDEAQLEQWRIILEVTA